MIAGNPRIKREALIAVVIALLVTGWFAIQDYRENRATAAPAGEITAAELGDLTLTITADGMVRANQTALLAWRTSGSVQEVNVRLADRVTAGQVLASLDVASLPQPVILAQVELLEAQKALDDLLHTRTQQSQARLAVEQAQEALEKAQEPELGQAEAQQALANAEKAFEEAQRRLAILETPVSASAIEQTHASMLLAENVLKKTDENIERIQKKLRKSPSKYMFWESRDLYKQILKNLEIKRTRDQRAYEDALYRYNRLLEPINPSDLAVAKADLAVAQAARAQASREWDRLKGGLSPADIAVLEARSADARREWERVKNGPTAEDISAAEARVTAAQAALDMIRLAAPFDGTITQVASRPGDPVAPGTVAFRLDDLSRLLAEVQISEVNINQIEHGQPVTLTFDSIPGKEYHGVITSVPTVGEILEDFVIFNAQVELTDADEQVKPGMTTSVKIVTSILW